MTIEPKSCCAGTVPVKTRKTIGPFRAVSCVIECPVCLDSVSTLDHSEGVVEAIWNSHKATAESKKLVELVAQAILIAFYRDGDVDTEDGTFATTDTDVMIRLESAIQDAFGMEAKELCRQPYVNSIIESKLRGLTDTNKG
ncbi:hypothetical protein I6Y99_004390 [Vibrio parahaemolyticus]|nr:hypothetical protein [Vibrio parahaemolyticus]